MMRYEWDEAHGAYYTVSGPFEPCTANTVVDVADYETLFAALLACRIHLATPAADESDLLMIDQIDAALRGEVARHG